MTNILFNILFFIGLISFGATFLTPRYYPKWTWRLVIIGFASFLLLMLL